jgi:REP element-mobilizing transposase RayT
MRPRLFSYLGGILRNHKSPLLAAGGVEDHLHLLVSMSRAISVAEITRIIKSNSSTWVKDELAIRDFPWQDGYGAFAVSHSQVDHVKAYLANQEEHHKRLTFQEESLELLQRHGIEWDERYVWD